MTDQDMDARLRAAGERFRAAHSATTAVDVVEVARTNRRRGPRVLLAVAAVAVVLLVVGLVVGLRGSHRAAPLTGDNAGLVGNVWLVSPDGKPSTAAFYVSRAGVLVADDECRLITAKARVSATRIAVTDVAVRSKPCTDQYGPGFYEQGTRILRGTVTFRIDSAGLTITHAGVGSLRFALAQTPIPPPSADIPTLTGADWVAPDGSVLHIAPSTGRLSGGWCSGRAVIKGDIVQFGGCPAAGQGRFAARLTGATLTLDNTSHGSATPAHGHLAFRWRPQGPSAVDPASLTDRPWRLESVDGAPASSGSLRIAGGVAVLDDGCTTYRRPVTVGAGTFTISGRAPTHACSDQASTADSFVFNDPATWVVRDDKLVVYGGGSQTFALVYGSATSSRSEQDPALLRAHPWQAPTSDQAVITFTRTGYTISHPCYYRAGSAQFDSTSIDVSGGRSVPHSCPFHSPQPTRSVDAVFSGRLRWSISSGVLTLSGSTGTLLLRPAGVDRTSLTSSAWHLASTTSDGRTRTAVGDVLLTFPTPRSLTVQRCYQSSAPVMVQSTTLTVRFLHTTIARPCPSGPSGTQEQNQVIDSVLTGTVSWAIDGDQLTLHGAAGALAFTRRP